MSLQSTIIADLKVFLSDFAIAAAHQAGAVAETIDVLFSREHENAFAGASGFVEIAENEPAMIAKTAELANFDKKQSVITIKSIAFRIREIQPDNEGLSVVVLTEST